MIRLSRRESRVGDGPRGPTFQLHLSEARRAALQARLTRGSLAAAAAAFVLLWLPLALPVRLLLTLGAASVAAAWRLPDQVQLALGAIRRQTGLSYETALGVLAGAEPDPYGLRASVVEQARLSLRGYARTQRPPWWLPALLLSAALTLLPLLAPTVLPTFARPSAPRAAASPQAPTTPESDAQLADPQLPQPERADVPAAPADEDGQASEPVPSLTDTEAAAQAPLSRYLESLRQKPTSSEAAGQAAREAGQDQQDAGQGAGTQRQAADPEGADSAERAGEGAASPAGDQRAAGDQQGAQPGDGPDQQAGAPQPGGDQRAAGDGQRPGEGGDEQAGQQAVDEGAGAPGAAADSGQDASAGAQDGAGVGGVARDDGNPEAAGAAGGPQQLAGVIQDGPESVIGSIRLPGSDVVDLPEGTAIAPYRSAAEEALTEGDLPLDYQEVIRRYFR